LFFYDTYYFITTTELGYGHGDDLLYLEILDEFYDDIERSYGDYGQILNNFIEQRENTHYVYYLILHNYINYGYYKEAYDCSIKLLTEIESFKIDVGYFIYMKILVDYFISVKYYLPDLTKDVSNHILKVCNDNPYMKNEYNKEKDYYDHLFLNI
jgi:hypothetical protein